MDIPSIALGTLAGTIWWLLFILYLQPYIIKREIDSLASGTSRYQEAIPLLTKQVFDSFVSFIREDPDNKKLITGIIHGYGKSLADQAVGMLLSDQNIKKMKEKAMQGGGGAAIDPMVLFGRVADKFLDGL